MTETGLPDWVIERREAAKRKPPIVNPVKEGAKEIITREFIRKRVESPAAREKTIKPPTDGCCDHVCGILNDQIDGLLNRPYLSKDQDKILKVLRDFRFSLFTNGSCQCADGEWEARKKGLPTVSIVAEQ